VYYTFRRKKVGDNLADLFGETPVFGAGAVFDDRGEITRHRNAFAGGGGFGGHGLVGLLYSDHCAGAEFAVARQNRFSACGAARVFVNSVDAADGIARPLPSFFQVDPIAIAVAVFACDVLG
jgi:hypothetical protein